MQGLEVAAREHLKQHTVHDYTVQPSHLIGQPVTTDQRVDILYFWQ